MKHKIEEYKLCYYWAKEGKDVAIHRLPIVKSELMKLREKQKESFDPVHTVRITMGTVSEVNPRTNIDYKAVDDQMDLLEGTEKRDFYSEECLQCKNPVIFGHGQWGKIRGGSPTKYRFCHPCHEKLMKTREIY